MNSVSPSVAKSLYLLRLTAHFVRRIRGGPRFVSRAPLEIAVELDAVGRVEVDALDFASQAFPFGEAGHDL